MIANANKEKEKYENLDTKVTVRQKHLEKWWLLWRRREELIEKLKTINRYIACGQVTKRPIFEFISSSIRPNAELIVFPMNDDYSFGILQSSFHWEWFKEQCSTLKSDFRYTSDSVFDTFPWPQWGTFNQTEDFALSNSQTSEKIHCALNIASAGRDLRKIRIQIMKENNSSLREIYRMLELPGNNPLKDAQVSLDNAVRKAYQLDLPKDMQKADILEILLELNKICSIKEEQGQPIIPPGLPEFCSNDARFISEDCVHLK